MPLNTNPETYIHSVHMAQKKVLLYQYNSTNQQNKKDIGLLEGQIFLPLPHQHALLACRGHLIHEVNKWMNESVCDFSMFIYCGTEKTRGEIFKDKIVDTVKCCEEDRNYEN